MNVWGSESASSRRTVVAGLLAAVLGAAATAQAQQAPAAPAAPAPAAAAQAPAAAPEQQDAFKFTSDAAVVIWTVKGDKTADFESVWADVLKKAATSDKPEIKAIADTLKIYKADIPITAQNPNATYFFEIDPNKAPTYNPTVLLYTPGLYERAAADELYKKLGDSIANISAVALKKVQ